MFFFFAKILAYPVAYVLNLNDEKCYIFRC